MSVVRLGMRTPWGRADYASPLAEGIGVVSTASHGGIKLDAARNRRVAAAWRRAGGWYEEDCDVNIVVYTFPEAFPDIPQTAVREALERWNAEELAAVEVEAVR